MNPHRGSNDDKVVLRLYVAGRAPNSVQAQANLAAIFERYAASDGYLLEIVDVLEEPARALEDGVFVTPTLVKLAPTPAHIVGSLNEREKVARLLGLR